MKNILIIFSILLLTSISAWAQPSLLIGEGVGDNGDEVCVDFSVRDFTLITAMNQLVFTWDPSEITFNQVQNFNLTGLSAANFVADVPAGTLTLNWEDVNCLVGPQGGGETLADDVVIFQLCFITLGIFGDVADINILGDPQPMIQREGDCTNIFSFRNTGHIFTGVTPVIFTGSDISGNTGDLVCMDLKVEGFDNMVNGQFTLEWDETLAAIESVIPGDVGNLAPSSFNTGIPGKLTMSWASVIDEPETVDDGTTFF